jgi:hypothetical protein
MIKYFFYIILLLICIKPAKSESDQSAEYYCTLADSLLNSGNYESALSNCNIVLKVNSSYEKALQIKAMSLYHLSKYNEALESIDNSLDLIVEHYYFVIQQSDKFKQMDLDNEYYQYADSIHLIENDFNDRIRKKAGILVKLGRKSEAEEYLEFSGNIQKYKHDDKFHINDANINISDRKDIIYTDASCIYSYGSASINYERMLNRWFSIRTGILKGFTLNGNGYWNESSGAFVMFNLMTSGIRKLEIGFALGYYEVWERNNANGIKAGFTVGSRYQPDDSDIFYRIGASFFGEWVGGGIHFSIGIIL